MKTILRRCVLAALSLLVPFSFSGAAESFDGSLKDFVRLTVEDGLASNNVYDVCIDRSGCIWMATAVGLSRYDGMTVTNFFKEEMTVRSNYVNYVYCDSRGRVWVGTDNGVAIYDGATGKFSNLELLTGVNIESPTAWLFEDGAGTMWVSFKKNGLMAVDCETFAARRYFYDFPWKDFPYFSRIWFDPATDLYLLSGFENGLYYADLKKEQIVPFRDAETGEEPFAGRNIKGILRFDENTFYITCADGTFLSIDPYSREGTRIAARFPDNVREVRRINRLSDTILGIATTHGVFFYDTETGELLSDKVLKNYPASFAGKSLHCLGGTLEDGLLMGAHSRGIVIQQDPGFIFTTVRTDISDRSVRLAGSDVSGFAECNDTTVWVSTRHSGLFVYNPKKRSLRKARPMAIPDRLEGICQDSGYIWTWNESGVYRINPETGDVDSYFEGGSAVYNLVPAPAGKVSILTDGRVFVFDPSKDSFYPVPAFSGKEIGNIARASDGRLLVHSSSPVVLVYDGNRVGKTAVPAPEISSSNRGEVIYQDDEGNVWISPSGSGIYIGEKKKVKRMTGQSGLYSEIVSNIIGDNQGNMFITTDRSLSMLSLSGKMFSATKSDGLINFGFSRNSAARLSSGEVLIGSRDGFVCLPPMHKTSAQQPQWPEVSGVHAGGSILPVKGGKVVIPYGCSSFDVQTVSFDPRHVNTRPAIYCLEGYDDTWTPIGEAGRISFPRIPAGRYRLKLFGRPDPLLEIRVRPHTLKSPGAITIYVILLLAGMWTFVIYVMRNERRKRETNILQMKIDLHKDKMDFFTGIAHEIKTPLTLITTPLNHIMSRPDLDEDLRFDLDVIDKNASYLTKLVKELMELSRIEDKKYLVNCTETDLCKLLDNIRANFSEQVSALDFRMDIPSEPLWVMADAAATMKICNNLLLNAVKYAEKRLEVTVRTEGDMAVLSFVNDGPVIPAEMRSKVFETFTRYKYDSDPGTDGDGFGIGLSVAKALSSLQGGSLGISPRSDLNEFVLSIPLASMPAAAVTAGPVQDADDGKKTILIVEDHVELTLYLGKILSPKYNLLNSLNGREAFELIQSRPNIDLVISDIRMPVMSGIELCSAIKKDITYSHIPVLLLSANLTPEVRIQCLEEGVDAMVEKPFTVEYLLSAIDNIFAVRRRLLEKSSSRSAGPEENQQQGGGLSIREALFLENLDRVIAENLTYPDFGVDELAAGMTMSQSSLNRKIRDLFRMTTSNYIREKRLERAEVLLKTTSMQINEICYKVGFQTPSYFIKCFRAKYGLSPNEYAKTPRK